MHFFCYCGHRIQDSSDSLRYKADFIVGRDWDDIWTWINGLKKLKKDNVDNEWIFDRFVSFWGEATIRSMYQCPECGRLYLCGNILGGDNQLYAFKPEFKPEKETNTCLLQSYLGDAWKGSLRAEWEEEPPEWRSPREHKGSIYVDVNGDRCDCYYSFDDYGEFEEKYYHLFHELKDICLRYATLRVENNVENKIVHRWSLEEERKEEE